MRIPSSSRQGGKGGDSGRANGSREGGKGRVKIPAFGHHCSALPHTRLSLVVVIGVGGGKGGSGKTPLGRRGDVKVSEHTAYPTCGGVELESRIRVQYALGTSDKEGEGGCPECPHRARAERQPAPSTLQAPDH